MSYPPNGNGYWPGHSRPNPYQFQETHPQPQSLPSLSNPPTNTGPYEYWSPNAQTQHAVTPGPPPSNLPYAQYSGNMISQQAQYTQYISPAQLMQQPSSLPQPPQQPQRGLQTPRAQTLSTPTSKNSYRVAAATPMGSTPDMPMLLVSLAEEYFAAARELSPSVALSMTDAGVNAYTSLIATGLGCLDAALKHQRLPPRLDANIRLRFAGVLFEETNNSEVAEISLSRGIGLCERNHYYDLKYAMQFLLAQIMAKKNRKVSMIALDGHIADAQTYQHYPWVYVFRFLRASYALKSGSLSDNHAAVQNLQAIANLASRQGDHAIHLVASLMEAMAHLKTPGLDSLEHVQTAIAAARSHQTVPTCQIPQLIGLTHILDLVCAIRQGTHAVMVDKLKAVQVMMDESLKDPTWGVWDDVIAVPIVRSPKSSDVVSRDTRTILGIGNDGGDNLMLSFLCKKDAYSITYLLSGIVLLHKYDPKDSRDHNEHKDERQKGLVYLQAGLESVEETRKSISSTGLLSDLVNKRQWREQMKCIFRLHMAFGWAGISDWNHMRQCIEELETSVRRFEKGLTRPFDFLFLFLKGVYYQGSGDLDAALRIFQDPKFKATRVKSSSLSSEEQVELDIGLLAAISTLWILQEPRRLDLAKNAQLIEELQPLCAKHPNKDIETVFNLAVACIKTDPPAPVFRIKNCLRAALNGALMTANTHFLCITLSVMFSSFFSGVVGEQAVKSAQAAVVQAGKTRNILWMSVTNGLLGECYDVQGKREEAQYATDQAEILAQKAMPSQ